MWSSSSIMWSLGDLGCVTHWAFVYVPFGAIFYWFDGIFVLNLNLDHKVFVKKFDQVSFPKNSVSAAETGFPYTGNRFPELFFCASFENCVQETGFLIWRNRFPESRMLFFCLFWGCFGIFSYSNSFLLILTLDCKFKCPIPLQFQWT